MTDFVILALDDSDPEDAWTLVDTVSAATPSQAASKYATRERSPGTYAAVPRRSWHVIDVAIEAAPKATAKERKAGDS